MYFVQARYICTFCPLYMKEVLGDLFIIKDAEVSIATTEGGKL